MDGDGRPIRYDLEDRTFRMAQQVRAFVRRLPRTLCNFEDGPQVVRASGSVGANYIEANEALSKKDFRCRIRICRKEAKETAYWLRLLHLTDQAALIEDRDRLVRECGELVRIFGAILRSSQHNSEDNRPSNRPVI